LAVQESEVRTIHEHIRDTAREHCSSDCDEDDFEFHGKELFAAEDYFSGRSPDERIEIYDAVLKGIETAGAEVIIRGVSKPHIRRRYAKPFHPHDIALMFTIESVERLARERECRVLLIADEAKEIEDAALRDLANYQELGTSWGWKTEQIERIVDTIHFVPSHRNPAIQLVDCATFVAARMRKIQAGLVADNRPLRQSKSFGRRASRRLFGTTRSGFRRPEHEHKKRPRRIDGASEVGADRGVNPEAR
jgi:hypothetical protein